MRRAALVLIACLVATTASAQTLVEDYFRGMEAPETANHEACLARACANTSRPEQAFVVGGEVCYIAHSKIAGFDHEKTQPTREEWGTVPILRVPL